MGSPAAGFLGNKNRFVPLPIDGIAIRTARLDPRVGEQGGVGGSHDGSVSVPVGDSGCTHWIGFSGGNCRHCLSPAGGEMHFG